MMKNCLRTLALLTVLCGATPAALALDPDPARASQAQEHVFDRGGVTFTWTEGHAISTTTLQAPEGPVEVVRVRTVNPERGVEPSHSFTDIVIFRQPLQAANPRGLSAAALALEHIVAGVQRAFPEGTVSATASGSDYTLTLSDGDTRATGRAWTLQQGDTIVVVYEHRAAGEDAAHRLLATITPALSETQP